MGGTAIGTGLNAPKGYAKRCAKHLAALTGKPIVPADDMIAATSDLQPLRRLLVGAQGDGDEARRRSRAT